MRNLSIEEKARRYDNLLVKSQEAKVDNSVCDERYCCVIDDIVPELKESEDEKVIRDIKVVLECSATKFFKEEGKMPIWYDRAVAWLEKQGEQKPVDKVESIFEVGNWVVNNQSKYTFLIKRGAPQYQAEDTNGDFCFFYLLPNGKEKYHLWTIEDAKDGDVLVSASNQPFIYNGKYTDSVVGAHIGINFDGVKLFVTETNNWTMNKGVKPATKEQRDTLFAKMKEKSFKWDAEKKELNKTIEIPFGTKDSELQEATYYIPDGYHAEINGNEVVIKKGKQNTTWKPTEEQIKALEHYVATIQESVYSYFHKDNAKLLHSLLEQLKKL